MFSLQEIETAVSKLSQEELAQFREWFAEFDAQLWDKQFEADVKAGKLEHLAQQALQDYKNGNTTEL